jgi:hypothetical protein
MSSGAACAILDVYYLLFFLPMEVAGGGSNRLTAGEPESFGIPIFNHIS